MTHREKKPRDRRREVAIITMLANGEPIAKTVRIHLFTKICVFTLFFKRNFYKILIKGYF